jgi:ribosomal protein L12E/L44/L45/RPP1/RPP2
LLRLDARSVKQRTQKLGIMVNGKSVSQPVSPLNSDDDIDLKPVTMQQQQQGTTTATKAAAAAVKGGGGKEEEDEEEENLDLEFGKYHTVDPDKMR